MQKLIVRKSPGNVQPPFYDVERADQPGCVARVFPSDTAEADAAVFAAAPDMLAAIEQFMPKGIAIGNNSVPDDLNIPMDVTLGELRAFATAIARARGETA